MMLRNFFSSLACFLIVYLTAPPVIALQPDEVKPPSVRLPVFVVTDRQVIGPKGSQESASLSNDVKKYVSSVNVPLDPQWMPSANELRDDLLGMGWVVDRSTPCFLPMIEDRGYTAEGARESLVSQPINDIDQFWKNLSKSVETCSNKRLYVYIHGFASSGINSVYTGGVLSSQVQAPVVVFSWPSDGVAGAGPKDVISGKGSMTRFRSEEAIIEDPRVLNHLVGFMEEAKSKLGPSTQFVIIAHSLGNRIMAKYFASGPRVNFAEVYFIAADVSKEGFYHALPGLKSHSAKTIVFSHKHDNVLYASSVNSILSFRLQRKLGLSKFELPGVEFIDYESVAEPFEIAGNSKHLLKHYLPFEQLGSIVRTGQPFNTQSKTSTPLVLVRHSVIKPVPEQTKFRFQLPAFISGR